ncbi:MAG TPA: phosphoenolpyruvate--protein phosphotransferase [Solirubrobacter sp.]|nr:phosphoenolpyruvate--protein phosphotransferase [Solirubrobacter sp.]
MVGLVIVSHSTELAEGVAVLAREMGGSEVAIEPAGGLEDGAIGTDAERVRAAVERIRSDDGVLVLMDLGSALMSAEFALEMLSEDGGPVKLSEAPLVEGAVAAAARARGGGSLDEVAAEARGALASKAAQLGVEEAAPAAAEAPAEDGLHATVTVHNRYGLHMRPAGNVAALAGRFDARVRLRNATRGLGPADGRSLTGIATLRVVRDDELEIATSGPQAQAALDALVALAGEHFGEDPDAELPAAEAAGGDGAASGAAPGGGGAAAGAAPGVGERAGGGDGAARGASLAPGARLRGDAVASGVAVGPARRLVAVEPQIDEAAPAGTPDEERARLEAARDVVRAELERGADELRRHGRPDEAAIFAAHRLLLDDAALLDAAARELDQGARAEVAFQRAGAEAAAAFRALDEPYLRARAVDVDDVTRRVLVQLTGGAPALVSEPGIVVADQLTPWEVQQLDPQSAWGIATARGNALDHASIIAAALGVPVVVGIGPALLDVADGTTLAFDGEPGAVLVAPDAPATRELERRRDEEQAERRARLARAAAPVALAGGRVIDVMANVGSPAEARLARTNGADGVGLLRTEFLFLDRATAPSESEQVAVLTEIAEALEGRHVVVRTLDAGADKPLPFLPQEPEVNPYLGQRGIRLSLAHPDVFETQLRAILRVAQTHSIGIMFPMVATRAELLAARKHVEAAREAVGGTANVEVGAMLEVPAAALQAEALTPLVDFWSVGTNDLSQYTMAAERGNAAMAPLLDAAVEPVLKLIAMAASAANAQGRYVSVCGELAGDPALALRLLDAGVGKLSMSPARIPAVKDALRGATLPN